VGYCVSYVQFTDPSYLYIRQTGVGECQGRWGGAEHEKGRASSRMGEDATKSIIKARVLRGTGPVGC
jgi:hypothetical protein